MTKLLNAAGRGGSGPAETTAKLTDLSYSDIVIDMCIVCRQKKLRVRGQVSLVLFFAPYIYSLTPKNNNSRPNLSHY